MRIVRTIGICLLAGLACSASAQSFSIDWSTIDGGGGTSIGGQFSLTGTIGQPDAGAMSGGSYTLTGGFWALPIAVQVTNAPTLFILAGAPGLATISWTPATPGFVLQVSDSLTVPNWTNAPSGANNPASISANLPARFYRLHKP